jgi:tetraacyldisaccharide 4'-kinase
MSRNAGHLPGITRLPTLPFLGLSAAVYFLIQSAWRKTHELKWAKSYQAPMPVVSVGNIAIGGTGKTPFVMRLVESLLDQGLKPCVISRGYRGRYTADYVLVSDGISLAPQIDPRLVGDEPFLMANHLMNKAPVIVGRDRIKCIEFVHENLNCDLAILDDGFQHLKLQRDVDIVLLSGRENYMFPLGVLREPISALSRADIVVLDSSQEVVSERLRDFLSCHEHYTFKSYAVALCNGDIRNSGDVNDLKGMDVLLVSAIANPDRFRRMVESLEWRVVNHLIYRDHHSYSSTDLTYILEKAGGATVVFTEKDWVKLAPEFQQRPDIFFLSISLKVDKSETFLKGLLEKLDMHGSKQ